MGWSGCGSRHGQSGEHPGRGCVLFVHLQVSFGPYGRQESGHFIGQVAARTPTHSGV